ncbi:MAG: hypothetical protein MUO26_13390 [Methanotrichaceae archaeon]|nr:hypothetical protein [Methanotrichaceae archaeon]
MMADSKIRNLEDEFFRRKSIKERVDYYIFTKNGYSISKHLFPFLIAILALFILSLPEENLLLKLIGQMQQGKITILAVVLTLSATIFYFFTILSQIRKAYLCSYGDFRRALFTSLLFIFLCTTLVLLVLTYLIKDNYKLVDIWACLLVSIVSLNGIGLPLPSSWAEIPDYTNGRYSLGRIAKILNSIYAKDYDISLDDFDSAMNDLKKNVEENLDKEPYWSREKMEYILTKLNTIIICIEEIKKKWGINSKHYFIKSCQGIGDYKEINNSFTSISKFCQVRWDVNNEEG